MGFLKFRRTVLKNMMNKPATYGYPAVPREYPEDGKGHVAIDIDTCLFCGMCARKCPSHAITVDRNAKTWTIRRMQCIQCRCCVGYCPKKCLSMKGGYTAPSTSKTVDTFTQTPKEEAPAAPAEEK